MAIVCFDMFLACALQTGLPMTALSVMGAQWRLKTADRAVLIREYVPWAARAAARSADLMSLYYEEHFEVIQCAGGNQRNVLN